LRGAWRAVEIVLTDEVPDSVFAACAKVLTEIYPPMAINVPRTAILRTRVFGNAHRDLCWSFRKIGIGNNKQSTPSVN